MGGAAPREVEMAVRGKGSRGSVREVVRCMQHVRPGRFRRYTWVDAAILGSILATVVQARAWLVGGGLLTTWFVSGVLRRILEKRRGTPESKKKTVPPSAYLVLTIFFGSAFLFEGLTTEIGRSALALRMVILLLGLWLYLDARQGTRCRS